ncbi:hypothetical protein [Anabaena sp. CCY 9910]|uniref:hypothetical protein n=1 Tax=Anabaena sp. CCY 9910 TaxID=3103870 RepID=UPI0039E1ECFB
MRQTVTAPFLKHCGIGGLVRGMLAAQIFTGINAKIKAAMVYFMCQFFVGVDRAIAYFLVGGAIASNR